MTPMDIARVNTNSKMLSIVTYFIPRSKLLFLVCVKGIILKFVPDTYHVRIPGDVERLRYIGHHYGCKCEGKASAKEGKRGRTFLSYTRA